MTNRQTLKDIQALAAEKGIILSAREHEHIANEQAIERERLIKNTPVPAPDLAARWNQFYPRLLQSIISIGETVLTFAQTIIVSLGVPVVLVLLLVVEHQRVVHGIQLFEKDSGLASFAALALVLLNLVLEFQIHHIEHKAGYTEERGKRWSLWITIQNAAYTFGFGESWAVQYVSPAQRYKGLLRLVTFSILALALVGSMREVISSQQGAWYTAIWAILTDSSLLLLMTWIGGLLFAAAAVLAAQGLSRYVAIRCVEIINAMSINQIESIDPYAEEVDRAGAMALLSIINAKEAAKAEKAVKTAKPKPVEAVVIDDVRPFGNTVQLSAKAAPELSSEKPDALANMPMIKPLPALVSNGTGSANGNGAH